MTTPPRSDRPGWRRLARRSTAWSAAAAVGLVLAAAVVTLAAQDDLPARVASHWGPGGVPDDTMALTTFLWADVALVLSLVALFSAISLAWGSSASTRRMTAAANVWSGGLGATLLLVTVVLQRGVTDVSTVAMPGGALVAVLLGPLVLAVPAALLVAGDPAQPATDPVEPDAARAGLAADERAVWFRTTQGGPGTVIAVVAILTVTLLAIVLQMWALLAVPVLLVGVFAAMFSFTVRVDSAGMRVRSALGWPRTQVPADEVVRASVVDVSPLGDFGGWGWRVGFHGGRVGVVLRSGEGLLVERTGERSLVVTVDDAATAAALLNTMADRARARTGGGGGVR
ncbi:uncharacterized protein DUF1648 [Isoptericola jiangsuensis]|uniref:Uncharacterized protein DUF1648 n=1 Tax=Isoptericola jiangsuensis TaxID=548579 RepID=A0A2A9EWX8_9MICO|nr:DUF1648 domain-containing protein [Isoptericola jiangsuensis]PFG42679.1 uncharacterized protein DUF1648 [Isoptericola jiangsuensis]